MKIFQSSVFRAVCAIAIGIMLVKYPDNTVTWITRAIGVLFLLSGVISMVVYVNALKHVSDYTITDREGRVVAGQKPTVPIVGIGSAILGLLLALTPGVFVTALMYIIGGILVLGAINQYMNLVGVRRFGHVGLGYWVFPSLVLLTGLYVLIRPMDPPALAMSILGWCTLLYGVTELINALKIHREKHKFAKAQEIPVAEEVTDAAEQAEATEIIEASAVEEGASTALEIVE